MSLVSFFDPEVLRILETLPRDSNEWKEAASLLNTHIKSAEATLREAFQLASKTLVVEVSKGTFRLDLREGDEQRRLFYRSFVTGVDRPVIEHSIEGRIEAYSQFDQLVSNLEKSPEWMAHDEKASQVQPRSLLELLKHAFSQVRDNALAGPALAKLLADLKRLREEAPQDDSDLKSKAGWFKRLAEALLSSPLLRQVFEQVKTQIPQVWSQLTLSQKLKVGAILPIVGAGAYLGGLGLAGGGGAVGVPVVIVILVLLMLNHSLIDFLDYLIRQISIILKREPTPEEIGKLFESTLAFIIKSLFGSDINLADASQPIQADGGDPRSYEHHAVRVTAERFGGVGFVTRYAVDGGIDGYVICESKKEVILVQAKCVTGKVGFAQATQYLGTLRYWQVALAHKFAYPVKKMVLACKTDFSIEAKKVAEAFPDELVLETITY